MKILAIGLINLKRLSRDPIGMFFIFVFPIIIIVMLGAVFGSGFSPRLGVVHDESDEAASRLVELMDGEEIEVVDYEEAEKAFDAAARGQVEAAVVVPQDFGASLAGGETVTVSLAAKSGDVTSALAETVEAAVARVGAVVRAVRLASDAADIPPEEATEIAEGVIELLPPIEVKTDLLGTSDTAEVGSFDDGATTQLVLFMFVNTLGGAVQLVQSRNLGVTRRMMATPTSAGQILLGETLGRFSLAMVQGLFIVGAGALLFGVDWGDPVAASALVVMFGLVSAGAAMFAGATLSNESQANALVPFGLVVAALGGCMVPLEIFSDTMQKVAHITPHAWAVEGFTELTHHDGGIADITLQLGVLALFAIAFLSLAIFRLRRAIVG